MIFRPHKCPPASTGEKFFIHVDVENAKKHTKECLFEDTIDCGLFFAASSANTSGRDVIMTLEVATFSQLQTKRLESTLRSITTRNTCSNSCEETENAFFFIRNEAENLPFLSSFSSHSFSRTNIAHLKHMLANKQQSTVLISITKSYPWRMISAAIKRRGVRGHAHQIDFDKRTGWSCS